MRPTVCLAALGEVGPEDLTSASEAASRCRHTFVVRLSGGKTSRMKVDEGL
jgi:hypothetical protein